MSTPWGRTDRSTRGDKARGEASHTHLGIYDGLDRLISVAEPHDSDYDVFTSNWITRYYYDLSMGGTVRRLTTTDPKRSQQAGAFIYHYGTPTAGPATDAGRAEAEDDRHFVVANNAARIQKLASNLGMSQGEYIESILEANADVIVAPPSSWKVFRFQRDGASDLHSVDGKPFSQFVDEGWRVEQMFPRPLTAQLTSQCRTLSSSVPRPKYTNRQGRSRWIGFANMRPRSRR